MSIMQINSICSYRTFQIENIHAKNRYELWLKWMKEKGLKK